jgi:hypothetical protein
VNLKGRTRKSLDSLVCLVLLGALLALASCGWKYPIEAPGVPVPPPVSDLKAEEVEGQLALSWSLPRKGDAVFGGLDGFVIYKCKTHDSVAWCPDCPMTFRPFLDVRLIDPWPVKMEGDRLIFTEAVETDYRYAYKVITYHRSGAVSKDSNVAFWPSRDEQAINDE